VEMSRVSFSMVAVAGFRCDVIILRTSFVFLTERSDSCPTLRVSAEREAICNSILLHFDLHGRLVISWIVKLEEIIHARVECANVVLDIESHLSESFAELFELFRLPIHRIFTPDLLIPRSPASPSNKTSNSSHSDLAWSTCCCIASLNTRY
jgi:hypothetical protein